MTEATAAELVVLRVQNPLMLMLLKAIVVLLMPVGLIITAAPAVAEPRCGFQGDWDCQGQPQYNGPLQNTWDHGYTTMPQLCPGGATMLPCQLYVPEP